MYIYIICLFASLHNHMPHYFTISYPKEMQYAKGLRRPAGRHNILGQGTSCLADLNKTNGININVCMSANWVTQDPIIDHQ